jgi:hypothetical protein
MNYTQAGFALHRHAVQFLALGLLAVLSADPAKAQSCTPHPLLTDCTAPPPFQCPADQLGPFCPGEPPFLGAFGNGVLPSGNLLLIDQDCDGSTNGPVDIAVPIPSELQNLSSSCGSCNIQYRLSPTQDFLYAIVSSSSQPVPGCSLGQAKVFFYAIDAGPALTGFTGDQGACLPGPISIQPVFHDEIGYPNRTAVMVGSQSSSAPVLWADLVGRVVNLDTFNYSADLQIPQFSPAGNAVLLTSINGGFATEFALVDLCVSPFAGSGSVTTRAANGAVSGVVTGTTGSLFAEITHGGTVTPFMLTDCICGACCTGMTCTADVFAGHCGGTFFPGSSCSPDPCGGGGGTDYTLTVSVVGSGNVTSNIGGINCPTVDCDADYADGTPVTLTASPNPDRIFVGWSGDCSGSNPSVNVTMDADRNCTATFRNPQADLAALDFGPTTGPLVAGTTMNYAVTVRNLGPESVSSFRFTVTPPLGFTPDPNSSDPGCNFPVTYQCTSPLPLNPGEQRTIHFGLAIDPDIRGDQTVALSVVGTLFDPDFSNNDVTVTNTVIGIADLGIVASFAPSQVPAGELVVAQARITNYGPSSATNLMLSRNLMQGLSLVDQAGNPVGGPGGDCTISELSPGGSSPAQVVLRVDPNLSAGDLLTIDLSISADEPDPNLSNNSDSVTLTVGGATTALPVERLFTLVQSGLPAPGGLGNFSDFFEARIDGDHLVFVASTSNGLGVFRSIGTNITAVASSSDVGPRYPQTFQNFNAPVLDGLDVYFDGIFVNPFNVSGIYRQSQCGIDNLMFTGDPAPGLGGEISGPSAQAVANNKLLLWNNGELLIWESGSYTPVALRGELTPGGGGATFSSMSLESDFDGQHVVFQAASDQGLLNGIYLSQGGSLSKIADSTDLRPETGTPFDNFNFETAVEDGYAAFARDIGQATSPATIYRYDIANDVIEVVVEPNSPMPGGGRLFRYITGDVETQDGRVFFLAYGENFRGAGVYMWENGSFRRVLAYLPAYGLGRGAVSGQRIVFTQRNFFVPGAVFIGYWSEAGDFDLDGDVDSLDAGELLNCMLGPENLLNFITPATAVECLSAFDADADDDLDMDDLAQFQQILQP